jgi:hypothetical protein
MKKLILLLFVIASMNAFAQEKATNNSQTPSTSARTSTTSVKAVSAPSPYDVNDKYMGRKDEFLNNLTVSSLPNDFPLYDKKMSLMEYNQVVDNFYKTHPSILKDAVKQKVIQK